MPHTLVIPQGNRLFGALYDIVVFFVLADKALAPELRPGDVEDPNQATALACKNFPQDLVFKTGGIVAAVARDQAPPDKLRFTLIDKSVSMPMPRTPPLGMIDLPVTIWGLAPLTLRTVGAIFATYVDPMIEHFSDAVSPKPQISDWPPTLQFARFVRNAVVHGGTINAKPDSPHVAEWRGIHYSATDRGRVVLGSDLSLGDLIFLMCDLEAEFMSLGIELS